MGTLARTALVPLLAAAALLCAPALANAGDYVVSVSPDADPAGVAAKYGLTPEHVWSRAVNGFSATMSAKQARTVSGDPLVQSVEPNQEFRFADVNRPQFTPNGVLRIGGAASPSADIDGVDERIDADIAIIDSGVDASHPDLDVVADIDCAKSGGGAFSDHGTLVAGVAAAIDNAIGVVGAAPGARVWSIRVANKQGSIKRSYLICAADWVAANASTIEVANMSVVGDGTQVGECGVTTPGKGNAKGNAPERVEDPLHAAICAGAQGGVTWTVAAGNDSADASTVVPAAYDEVITVSAIADFDGQPDGLAAPNCFGTAVPEEDDTFAVFSNFGAAVDIAAPGVCIASTMPGTYGYSDGTSFAAPFVAGAAAIYRADNPLAGPENVKAALIGAGEPGAIPQDPDTFPEPVLNISTL